MCHFPGEYLKRILLSNGGYFRDHRFYLIYSVGFSNVLHDICGMQNVCPVGRYLDCGAFHVVSHLLQKFFDLIQGYVQSEPSIDITQIQIHLLGGQIWVPELFSSFKNMNRINITTSPGQAAH